MECTCPYIMIGSERSDSKNWNPACKEHGWESEWYNSPEQVRARLAEYERHYVLQRLARERRKGNISRESAQKIIKKLDNRRALEQEDQRQQEE